MPSVDTSDEDDPALPLAAYADEPAPSCGLSGQWERGLGAREESEETEVSLEVK